MTKLKGKKSANKYIAQNPIFFIIFNKSEKLDLILVVFSQTHVNNQVNMVTASIPGDQNAYEMIGNRLTIKATKVQQSSANRF